MTGTRIALLLVTVLSLSACATADGFIQDSESVGTAIDDTLDG